MINIAPVRNRSDLSQFLDLPWSIYQNDSLWAPPIKSSVSRLLNTDKHPFWKFSTRELFLARRGDQVVGRIVALVDNNSNSYHNEKVGAWGFFECEQDPEAAAALFSEAEKWVKAKGMEAIRGPLNPSTNYEVGLLVQGFDKEPALMMSYNPPYYLELIHGSGYRKEKDLFSYRITLDFKPPEWAIQLAEKISQKEEVSVRHPKKWSKDDIRLLCSVYHDCWKNNWGFVPTTEEEEIELADNLLFLIEPELAFFLYYKDEPVGIGLMLPDFNPLLRRFNGKLGLSALVKKYLYESEIRGLRGLLFGVKEEYRQSGLPLVVVKYVSDVLEAKGKYEYAELGWSLEDNDAINSVYEDEAGFPPDKRYRIFRKNFT